MDTKELHKKSPDVLKRELAHLREELRDLRFKVSQNQHKDVRALRNAKRDIARILTELRSRTNQS